MKDKPTWEERFDEEILLPETKGWGIYPSQTLAIKSFISLLLKEEREEIVEEIRTFLKAEMGLNDEVIKPIKPNHGTCCYCSDCGQYHEDCVCESNRYNKFLASLTKEE